MRLVMMGTGPFAVPSFEALLAAEHEVLALVTRPQKGRRGKLPPPNPMRLAGQRAGVTIHDPASINQSEAVEWLRELNAELMVVCDYGEILSSETLEASALGGINLHASLLPEYRGAAPINWALYDGKTETGVSVIHMTPRLDAGPVLLQRRVKVDPQETAIELESRLAVLGSEAILAAVQLLGEWDRTSPLGTAQANKRATKAPRLRKQDGLIDWRRSASQIANQVRAFKPWPGTFTYFPGTSDKPVRLILDEVTVVDDHAPEAVEPGTLVACDPALVAAAGKGHLRLDVVKPEGKKQLQGAEFQRGYRLSPGTRLGVGQDGVVLK